VEAPAAVECRRILDCAAGFGGAEETRRQGADWLLAEMAVAGLRGRGGAAFPLWTKWEAALAHPAPRVVVVNGAEDEPGSLKDRYLLATRPELVVDGALCTALALGASRVVLYINEEADGPLRSAAAAVMSATGQFPGVRLDVVAAPAAYVFGEDSCAVEFIETGDRTALSGKYCALGRDSLIGAAVYSVQDKFRLKIVARTLSQFEAFLPNGAFCERLADAIYFYLGDLLDYDVEIAIPTKETRPLQLGQFGRLGWTSWSAGRVGAELEGMRRDCRFHPTERAAARRAGQRGHVKHG